MEFVMVMEVVNVHNHTLVTIVPLRIVRMIVQTMDGVLWSTHKVDVCVDVPILVYLVNSNNV